MPDRQRAVVCIYLRTGSRFESRAENGLSHFVEHMLFRGTERYPSSHELASAFEDLGGTLEAMTAADHGSLGISVPRENISVVLSLLAEVFAAPLFRDLDIERGIIVEEILEDLSDKGEMVDPASLIRKLSFPNHGLSLPITGPVENVERFSLEELRSHHRRTYQGHHTVISVAGPVDPQEISRQIQEAFSVIVPGKHKNGETPVPAQSAPRFVHVDHPGSSQTSLSLGYRCLGRQDPQQAALEMLLRIIDDGMSTRLYHEICDARGLCYSVAASYETYADTGIVELEADTAHERAPEVLSQMLRVTDELAASRITEKEFTRAQNRVRWQFEALLDDVDEVADFMAHSEYCGTAPTPLARLEELRSVSREDIRDVAARVFSAEGRNVVSVGTQHKAGRAKMQAISGAT